MNAHCHNAGHGPYIQSGLGECGRGKARGDADVESSSGGSGTGVERIENASTGIKGVDRVSTYYGRARDLARGLPLHCYLRRRDPALELNLTYSVTAGNIGEISAGRRPAVR